MATYTLVLTPALRNLATEGSLDTAVVNGASIQRSGYIEVHSGNDRKIVAVMDGETFTDEMQSILDLGFVV